MLDCESWLAAVMIELAALGTDRFSETDHAADFAERLGRLLSPAEVGLLIPAGASRQAVATGNSERALSLMRLEAGGTAGPATECHRTGLMTLNEPLAAARTRWPGYAAWALAAGLGLVSALPMRHREEAIGTVIALSAGDRPLGGAEADGAELLTEAAAVSIGQHRVLERSLQTSRQLQHALDSRVVIEQAKGVIAARLDIAPGDAFDLLRGYARHNGLRLADVAGDAVRGTLPARDLAAHGATARDNPARHARKR